MNRESILVVEDEEIMRDSLVDWFSAEGRTVHTAVDGDEALAKHKLENYDAMIIDLKLPGRSGLDVLAEVKRRNPKARVVIVTAYPSYETAVEAMRRGAVDYLPKPFELEKLEASLHWAYEEIVREPEKIVPPPIVEEPLLPEENVTPCIWTQAGIVQKRMCMTGYQCNSGCDYHAAMMKREKFKSDPRIKPYLTRLNIMQGTQQCRYVMSGDVAARQCSQVYNCDACEFSQLFHERVEQQLAIKAENKRRKQAARKAREKLMSVAAEDEPPERVH